MAQWHRNRPFSPSEAIRKEGHRPQRQVELKLRLPVRIAV